MSKTIELARHLETLHINDMYKTDFYWTWDKTDEELEAIFTVADALRDLRERNKSTRIFDSGLGISIFRDNSTRTRFSFASACNLLGLEVQDLDEKKSQIAHGETVRETANMVSFMADVIGIRDDMFIGEGHKYQKTFMDAVKEGYRDGILEQQPTLVNLQCDVDHPTQCMADMLHVIHYFGGVENLKGKKIAMTWAYSPSYGKPLSVPQGVIGLMSRFGMDVVLAHPEGYEVMPEVEEIAKKNAAATGGSYKKVSTMEEAFDGADIVYPKSWAPFAAMEKRTNLYAEGDSEGIKALEKELLAQNAELCGAKVNKGELFTKLFNLSLQGAPDCGGVIPVNYYSGEGVTHFDAGRPMLLRGPESDFSLANLMRANIYSAFATLAIGLDILNEEHVALDTLLGHGGLFKTPGVAQRYLAAAAHTAVTCTETAGEGGPYGMALLAAYRVEHADGETLANYLQNRVFAGAASTTLNPDAADEAGFAAFLKEYKKALCAERTAVETM